MAFLSLSMVDGLEKLIMDAISGESSAFGLLYDEYQPRIYRFIYLKVSHREEAEDLTHQVFLNALEKINNFKIGETASSFSGWLYQIARNKVIDHYRTKKITFDIETIQIADGIANDKILDKNLEFEKIRKAIPRLTPIEQDVIIMRFVEELSPREVSAILNKSEGSVRLIQHRAIKNLKKILTQ